jgi:hypothetical protein
MMSGRFASRIIATVRSNDEGDVGVFAGNVLGKFEMDGSGALFDGHAEGVTHHGGNRSGRDDLSCHLGQRTHCADDVHDLEACLPRALDRFLAGDHDHGHGAEMRVGRARGEVQRAWPQGR